MRPCTAAGCRWALAQVGAVHGAHVVGHGLADLVLRELTGAPFSSRTDARRGQLRSTDELFAAARRTRDCVVGSLVLRTRSLTAQRSFRAPPAPEGFPHTGTFSGPGPGRWYVPGDGHPATEPRRHQGPRPRPGRGLLHRRDGPRHQRADRRPPVPQVLGRGGPPLGGRPLRPVVRHRPVHVQGRGGARPGGPRTARRAVRRRRPAGGEGRGTRRGRVDPLRDAFRSRDGAGPRGREGGRAHREAATRASSRKGARASPRRGSTTC